MTRNNKIARRGLPPSILLLLLSVVVAAIQSVDAFLLCHPRSNHLRPSRLHVGLTLPSYFGANATHSYDFLPLPGQLKKNGTGLMSRTARRLGGLHFDVAPQKNLKGASNKKSPKKQRPSMQDSSSKKISSKQLTKKKPLLTTTNRQMIQALNPLQKLWLLFVKYIVPKEWLEYNISSSPKEGGANNRPSKRVPVLILLFKAMDLLLLSPKKSSKLQKRLALIAAANTTTTRSMYSRETKELTDHEWRQAFLHEAQTHLYRDPVVRAAVGYPMKVVDSSSSTTTSSSENADHMMRSTTTTTRTIRVHGQWIVPLELGFRVQGSRASGVAIAMATKTEGIVKLTLHLLDGAAAASSSHKNNGRRVIPVSIVKRSAPIPKL